MSVTGELDRVIAAGMRGGLTPEERSADRRRRVMDAALELFGTRGYAVVPVDRICRTAGISTKSFYPLFDNKEALFTELYDELVSDLAARVISAPVDGHSTAESVAIRLGALVHAVVDDPRVARVVLVESAGLSPAVEQRRRAVHAALASFVVETTGRFVAAGELPDRDYYRASLGLVGAINELIIDFVHNGGSGAGEEVDHLITDLVDLFMAVRRGLVLDND